MLSNAYFLAKFRFDTAENEPAKNLQNFAKFANFADPNPLTLTLKRPDRLGQGGGPPPLLRLAPPEDRLDRQRRYLGQPASFGRSGGHRGVGAEG